MAKLTPRLASFIILQTFATEILSSHAQSLNHYLQLAVPGPHAPLVPPSSPVPASHAPGAPPSYPSNTNYGAPPSYQTSSYQTPSYQNAPRPNPSQPNPLPVPLSAIASIAAPIPVLETPSLPKPPSVPKPSGRISASGLDSNVLNNLAIALQLLIVSNMLNMPAVETAPEILTKLELSKFESMPKYETVSPIILSYPIQPSVSLQTAMPHSETPRPQSFYSYESQNLPNAHFIGSSGFVEPTIFGSAISAKPNARSSMTLISPYEALGPNSPYSDPILSSVYSPSYSKNDFQSPYASILAADGHRDLFSVSDLF